MSLGPQETRFHSSSKQPYETMMAFDEPALRCRTLFLFARQQRIHTHTLMLYSVLFPPSTHDSANTLFVCIGATAQHIALG